VVQRINIAGSVLAVALLFVVSVDKTAAAQEQAAAEPSPPAAADADPGTTKAHPSNGMKTLDAVVVRPVTFVSSIFSTATYVLALPFAALDPAMDVEKTTENIVRYPFGYTFKRPLGDFSGSAW
jgi:hypothetical protein